MSHTETECFPLRTVNLPLTRFSLYSPQGTDLYMTRQPVLVFTLPARSFSLHSSRNESLSRSESHLVRSYPRANPTKRLRLGRDRRKSRHWAVESPRTFSTLQVRPFSSAAAR